MRSAQAKSTVSKINYYLCGAIIAVLIWSTSFVGTKMAYASFPPLTLGAVRFLIAAAVLGIVRMVIKEQVVKPTRKDLGLIALSGLLGTTIYFALENIGLDLTSASNAALIIASYPAITALLEFIFYRTRISWVKGLGIAVAIFGIYLISGGTQGGQGEQELFGNSLLIAAGVVFALYTFTTRKVVSKYSMLTISYYQMLIGSIAFIPLAFFEVDRWQIPTSGSMLMVVYLGIFCSVIAFFLYNLALRNLSSSTAVALMNLVPVFGVLLSVVVLNEVLRGGQYIGGIIVLIGVVLSVRETKTS
ncbi:DMT family transporter [Sporosarcina sp. HYO08]|uniref:DMT family transporter n=1 Tax=Sporosarcina sp. HYO08 TaxID=1759557 RepID=UPI0020A56539|nr:DMT family transporter [Sporosarcina sp. HYO08]